MRRRIASITLFLLLIAGGAIVNVAVAWGLAFDRGIYNLVESAPGGYPLHWSMDPATRRLWQAFLHEKPGRSGVEVVSSEEFDAITSELTSEVEVIAHFDALRVAGVRELPSWSAVRSLSDFSAMQLGEIFEPSGAFEGMAMVSDRAFGWPVLGLACHWHSQLKPDAAVWKRTVSWGLTMSETDAPKTHRCARSAARHCEER